MRTKLAIVAGLALMSSLGFGQFDFGGGAARPSQPSTPWSEFKLNPKTTIKLDFRNANVDSVVALFSKASGINIIKDPALTGAITVTSAKAVSLDEAFQILQATLSLKNYDMRKEGNLLVIRQRRNDGRGGRDGGGNDQGMGTNPFGNMNPDDMRRMFEGNRANLKVYPIKYANASQVARVINEVFLTTQNPFESMFQQMMGGGGFNPMQFNMGGGRGNQGGRPGQNNNNRFQGMNFNRGGFGGGGGSTIRASSDDYSNSVIVNAPSSEQGNVENLIKQIDKETDQPLAPKVFKLEFAVASDIAAAVQNVLTANAPKGRGGAGNQNVPIEQRFQQAFRFGNTQAAFGTVVADARTNSLIVTATEENLKLVDQVIKDLDTEITYESNVFVFPLANARASDISTLLGQAFGSRNGGQNNRNTGFGTNRNTGNQQNRNNQNNQNNRNNAFGGGGGGGRGTDDSGSAMDGNNLLLDLEDPEAAMGMLETTIGVAQGGGFGQFFGGQQNRNTASAQGRDSQGRLIPVQDLTGQVTVIPDQNTNSVIVVTSPENADLIRSVLGTLDRIPEQVMIETIIVEATLDKTNKFGVEWNYVNGKPFGQSGGSDTTESRFNLQNANPALQGFRYTLSGGNLSVFMNAMQTDQKFKVLSTPRIFTSNNAEAQINISQRVPYVLSSREDVNGNLTFTYAFEDVGIVLTVTPRITSNGYVTMDIDQQANDLQGFTDFNAPIINQRSANTTVSVKDGETVVLGGIIRNTVSSTTRKIPLLGDIPLLGNLFKTTDKQDVQTELMVFLTPKLVRDEDEARKLREEQVKGMTPDSQKSLGKVIPPKAPTSDKSPGAKNPPTTTKPPTATPPPTGGGSR